MSEPSHEIPISANVVLLVIDGKLCAKHSALAEPTPIDAKQLERWVLRQLREVVA